MNFLKFIGLSFVLCFFVSTAFATDVAAPIVKIESEDGTANLNIFLANLLEEETALVLLDGNGNAIYSAQVNKQNSFAKKWNLKHLKDGKYVVEIEHKKVAVTQPILLEEGEVSVIEAERVEIVAPLIELHGDKVLFRLAPTPLAKRVQVEIMKDAELLYETTEVMTAEIIKQYDLSNFYPDTYTFKLTIDDKSYFQKVRLQ